MNFKNKEVAKIFPSTDYIKNRRRDFLIFLLIGISFLIITIYFFYLISNSTSNLYEMSLFFILIIASIFLIILSFFLILKIEPIILYDNGIVPYESKLKIDIIKKRDFIHLNQIRYFIITVEDKNQIKDFSQINEINKYNKISKIGDGIEFRIVLTNNKIKRLILDKLKNIHLILDTFYRYKSINNNELKSKSDYLKFENYYFLIPPKKP